MSSQDLSKDLSKILNKPNLSDVTFLVGESKVKFYGHKAILAARSAYFNDVFGGDRATESTVDGEEIEPEPARFRISLKNLKAESFEKILKYIYTGHIEINDKTVFDYIESARILKLDKLTKLCVEQASKLKLTSSNVIPVLTLAVDNNRSKLVDDCTTFIVSNASDVFKDPSFVKVPHSNLLTLLANDDLNITEIEVFQAVQKWGTLPDREEKLKEVLEWVRFPTMESSDISSKVEPSKIVPPALLTEAKKARSQPKMKLDNHRGIPRKAKSSASNNLARKLTTSDPKVSKTLLKDKPESLVGTTEDKRKKEAREKTQ